jgi:hypothetical protein
LKNNRTHSCHPIRMGYSKNENFGLYAAHILLAECSGSRNGFLAVFWRPINCHGPRVQL